MGNGGYSSPLRRERVDWIRRSCGNVEGYALQVALDRTGLGQRGDDLHLATPGLVPAGAGSSRAFGHIHFYTCKETP